MNGLSWLLYLASVSDRIGFAAGPIAFFSGVALIVAVAFSGATKVTPEEWADGFPEMARRSVRWTATVFVLSASLSWFLPSRDTLMLIAASEVGETVLASKDVQNIGGEAGALATDSLRLLRKYVSEQLGETAAPKP